MSPSPRSTPPFLLTTRAALVLAVACLIGVLAATLTFLATGSAPMALLAAGSATGGSIGLLDQIVGDDRPTG